MLHSFSFCFCYKASTSWPFCCYCYTTFKWKQNINKYMNDWMSRINGCTSWFSVPSSLSSILCTFSLCLILLFHSQYLYLWLFNIRPPSKDIRLSRGLYSTAGDVKLCYESTDTSDVPPYVFDNVMPSPDAQVDCRDLKSVYDKIQRKTLKGSEQRVADAKVNMVASATAQIVHITVYVQRCPEAVKKRNDDIGKFMNLLFHASCIPFNL